MSTGSCEKFSVCGMGNRLPCVNADGLGAFVSASRSILYAYGAFPGFDGTREGYRASVRAQAQAKQRDVYAALKAHCLQMDY